VSEHKNAESEGESLSGLSTRALRARRRRLLARVSVPDLEGYVAGSLVEQSRRCGKPGCRCAAGDLHGPYVYLSVARAPGRRGLIYVPATLADLVAGRVAAGASVRQLLAAISAINVELLARRELE
jgi:hypothetical protein